MATATIYCCNPFVIVIICSMQNMLSVMPHIKMGPQWHLAHNVIKHIFVIGPLAGSETNPEHTTCCCYFFFIFWLLLLLSKQATKKGSSSSCFDLSIVFDAFALSNNLLRLKPNSIGRKGETRLKHRTIVSCIKGKKEYSSIHQKDLVYGINHEKLNQQKKDKERGRIESAEEKYEIMKNCRWCKKTVGAIL